MLFQLSQLIVASLAITSVTAEDVLVYPHLKRAVLEPRQSIIPDLPASCTTDVLGLLTSLPTPPARLLTASALRNPCSATVPSSLTSEYSSYSSRLRSWYDNNSDDVSSVFSDCPQLRSLASSLPVCATSILGGVLQTSGSTTTTGSSTTSSSSSSSSGTSSSSTSSETSTSTTTGATTTNTGAAARETGAAIAAMAAAGLLAAIF